MGVFGNSNSLFETLGQSREKVLAQKPRIPPPGQLARAGAKPVPATVSPPSSRFGRGAASSIERAVDDLLDMDGDPILVIDDELDVSALTPEDALVDEPPTKILGVRTDTAVVFAIGLVLVVAIAFFAGRAGHAKPEAETPSVPIGKIAVPPAPKPQAPLVAPNTVEREPAPETAPTAPAAKPETPETSPEAKPSAPVADGLYEIRVVTTSTAKATDVVKFLNESMLSPIAGKAGLQAYAKKAGEGAQVRIRGFDKADPGVLESVKTMSDPTGGGGFHDAGYYKLTKK